MKQHCNCSAVALLAVAAPSHAQQQRPVRSNVRLESRKVVAAADGKETFAAAESAKPGDVIEYTATYRNTTRQAIKGLEATIPVPSNTEFVAGSQRPAQAKASLDARTLGRHAPSSARSCADGREVEEQVPVREYRYLRWFPGELGGDKTMTFTARVRVVQ
jgi:uncharacterized repeat protein (TIGR01451 family)